MDFATEDSTGSVLQNLTSPDYPLLPFGHANPALPPLMAAAERLRVVSSPVIVCLSILGNSLMVAVIYRLRASRSTMDQYLAALALSDTAFLLSSESELWTVMTFGVSPAATNDAVCKVMQWLWVSTKTSSAWLLVAMTTQRALSVVWPHRVNVLCTSATSWSVIAGTVVTSALINCHTLYGTGVIEIGASGFRACTITDDDYFVFMTRVWTYIDLCLEPFLPFACILLANVVLVVKLRQALDQAGHRLGADQSQRASRASEARSVSLTVILLSLSYIVLAGPSAVNNLIVQYTVFSGTSHAQPIAAKDHTMVILLEAALHALSMTNYCLNFFLYCLTGARFRDEFKKMVCAWKKGAGTAE